MLRRRLERGLEPRVVDFCERRRVGDLLPRLHLSVHAVLRPEQVYQPRVILVERKKDETETDTYS